MSEEQTPQPPAETDSSGLVKVTPGIKADTPEGEVELRVGYQLNPATAPHKVGEEDLAPETFTHKKALRLLNEHPAWFRLNIIRGWYEPSDNYWK